MMKKDSYEEKSSSEDNVKFTGLVDYSSSSEDEDHAPFVNKRRLGDSEPSTSLNADDFSNYDLEEEDETVLSDILSDDGKEEEYFNYATDNDLLVCGPYSWRTGDRWNRREVYCVIVDAESPRTESRCLELLNEIGCEERFLGCSVETKRTFFAQLNEDEATKIQGVEGVYKVKPRRFCISDM